MAEFGSPKLKKFPRKSDLIIHLYPEQTWEFFSENFSQEEVEDKQFRPTGSLGAQLQSEGHDWDP